MLVFHRPPPTPAASLAVHAKLDERLELDLFKALAESHRLRILSCLIKCGRQCSASEIAEACDIEFSVVNKHLKVLVAAGALQAEKRGRTVWYSARCGELTRRLSTLVDAIAEWCPNLPSGRERTAGEPCCTVSGKGARPGGASRRTSAGKRTTTSKRKRASKRTPTSKTPPTSKHRTGKR